MVKVNRGVRKQSLTVEDPDDIGECAFTPTEERRLTRFVQRFCPYKRGHLDPQRKVRKK